MNKKKTIRKVFLCILIFLALDNHVVESLNSRNDQSMANSSNEYSMTEYDKKRSAFMEQFRINTERSSAIAGSSITFTCSIDLDDVRFLKSGNYKVNKSWRKLVPHFSNTKLKSFR